jgi:hypothetical protein
MNGKCWHCDATDHDTAGCPGRKAGECLKGALKALRVTPAMEAGVADRAWNLADLFDSA